MYGFMLHLCGAVLLCLSFGLSPLHAQSITGPEIAQRLNQAYASTPDRCIDDYPAYYCSGVLLKQVSVNDPQPFWSHGPDALARGAERFDYLRRDVATASWQQANGYLFADRFTAIGQGKDYQLAGDDGMSRPPELLVRNWGSVAPERLPLLGLYRDRQRPESLATALRDQRLYFQATGEWLPILRLDAGDGQTASFGFDLKEQLYRGYQVADQLNRRYADTAPECANQEASYFCNGVLIRGLNPGPGFHSWNPSPWSVSAKGVSFSYLRSDVGARIIVYSQGFIFHESQRPVLYPITLRCAYAGDAGTTTPDRCRANCAAAFNITSVAAYRARYGGTYGRDCAFGPTASEFQLNTDVRAGMAWAASIWNEIIIAPWTQDIPEKLPLEAFFYTWTGGAAGLAGAKSMQRDYYQVTGRFLPIVLIDLTAAPGFVFKYDPLQQDF